MYIDEIKKLLKDIEKSIQGDRRWIETGDYKIREKMESILENSSRKQLSSPNATFVIPNEFILPQFNKKNNFIPQISNFIDSKTNTINRNSNTINRKTIRLPENILPKEDKTKTTQDDLNIRNEDIINVRSGDKLYLTAREANGKVITGDGMVIITDLNTNPGADLSKIRTSGGNLLQVSGNQEFYGRLNKNTKVQVDRDSTLRISARDADGLNIEGDGFISIYDKDKYPGANLRNITTKQKDRDTITKKESEEDVSSKKLILKDGETRRLTAKEADGMTITGNGNVIITDLDKYPNANLAGVKNNGSQLVQIDRDVNFKGSLPSKANVSVSSGNSFALSAENANGINITGDGNVTVTDLDKYPSANLAGIKNKGSKVIQIDKDVNFKGRLPTDPIINVSKDRSFKLSAEKADGINIIGTGDVTITDLDKHPNANLSKISNNGRRIVRVDDNIRFNGLLPDYSTIEVADGKTVELTADQANGKTIIGKGNTLITNLDETPNADLFGIRTTGENRISVEESVDFRGKLPDKCKIDVNKDKQLILTAKEANNKTIEGNGSTVITGLDQASQADLSKIRTQGGTIIKIDKNTNFKGKLPPQAKIVGDQTKKMTFNGREIKVKQDFDRDMFEKKYNLELDSLANNVEALNQQIIAALGNFT